MIWREALGDEDTRDWEAAVTDLRWVTHQLLQSGVYDANREDTTKLKRYATSLSRPPLHY